MSEEITFSFTIFHPDDSQETVSDDKTREIWAMVRSLNEVIPPREGASSWAAAVRELNSTVPGLKLDSMGGYVPIQGSGTYQDEVCYFRSRGQYASFSVGIYDSDPDSVYVLPKRRSIIQVVPSGDPFGAGYLTATESVVILRELLIPNLRPVPSHFHPS